MGIRITNNSGYTFAKIKPPVIFAGGFYDYIWLIIYILFLLWTIFYADMNKWERLIGSGSVILLILKSLYVK